MWAYLSCYSSRLQRRALPLSRLYLYVFGWQNRIQFATQGVPYSHQGTETLVCLRLQRSTRLRGPFPTEGVHARVLIQVPGESDTKEALFFVVFLIEIGYQLRWSEATKLNTIIKCSRLGDFETHTLAQTTWEKTRFAPPERTKTHRASPLNTVSRRRARP